jgi:hypothetical protein
MPIGTATDWVAIADRQSRSIALKSDGGLSGCDRTLNGECSGRTGLHKLVPTKLPF